MTARTAALASPTLWLLALRILVAAALGGLIGFEREYRGQPAGFRTHILVSVGAALFTLVGVFAAGGDGAVDATRVAAQVVTGIGFLGAGAIIQQGISIRGLTTAATLWVTAAVGTAAGLGYYSGAIVATVVTVFALVAFKRLERRLFPHLAHPGRELVVDIDHDVPLATVTGAIERHGGRVLTARVEADESRLAVRASVWLTGATAYDELVQELAEQRGVQAVAWHR